MAKLHPGVIEFSCISAKTSRRDVFATAAYPPSLPATTGQSMPFFALTALFMTTQNCPLPFALRFQMSSCNYSTKLQQVFQKLLMPNLMQLLLARLKHLGIRLRLQILNGILFLSVTNNETLSLLLQFALSASGARA
jgi:hypothetical protein